MRRAGPERYPLCGALSTPRISLATARTGVRAVSTRVSDVCRRVGTRRVVYRVLLGGWYWVGTTPSPPTQYPAGLYIGIARAQPLASPRFCVHQGTPGPLLGPSAHPGSSHSNMPSWDQ